jgi:DNA-binding MarR family transcriptional regulator
MEDDSSSLGFLLHDVARLMRKRFEQHARGSGLTRSQWQVLAYLSRNEGISQTGLADLLDIEPITLGRIIDRLVEMELVQRVAHASDRRVWCLYLAEAARPKLKQVRELGELTRRETLAGVSEADRDRLIKTLLTLKSNLSTACDAPVVKKKASHG